MRAFMPDVVIVVKNGCHFGKKESNRLTESLLKERTLRSTPFRILDGIEREMSNNFFKGRESSFEMNL